MRRAAVPLRPEEIWLGEPWEEPPAPRRRPRAASSTAPAPLRTARTQGDESPQALTAPRPRPVAPPSSGGADRTPLRVAAPPTPADPRPAGAAERRTVTIRGRGAERDLTWMAGQPRRRPTRPVHQRPGFRPDRAALWAVVLGLLLVLVAATSSHAAVRAPSAAAARTRDGAAPAAPVMAIPAFSPVRAQAVLRHRA